VRMVSSTSIRLQPTRRGFRVRMASTLLEQFKRWIPLRLDCASIAGIWVVAQLIWRLSLGDPARPPRPRPAHAGSQP